MVLCDLTAFGASVLRFLYSLSIQVPPFSRLINYFCGVRMKELGTVFIIQKILGKEGYWLWLSWLTDCFRHQRSEVQIQSTVAMVNSDLGR